ncbi:flagellar export chaperone FlgN [Pantoea sp. 1.19]|uniref:flagellar export chaperone FlgN n=1 Tax=Pantoea sp. 1.19 TaxID=1925589 RepID=UPI000948F9FD|nr:flagellar export chaperone FlgN [Pantoea sp. 1.19]
MQTLSAALEKMQEVLTSLAEVMAAEQQQLAAGRLNSSLLQRITEDKQSLLNTLHFFDQQRQAAEQSLCLTAPYPGHGAAAARWQAIRTATAALRDINVHNGLLLEQQMAHNQASLALLRPHQSQHFYGPNGLAVNTPPPSRKV